MPCFASVKFKKKGFKPSKKKKKAKTLGIR
jgi:hypothetical protein